MTIFEKFDLLFKTVEVEDAEFILSLRTDPKLSRHLSATANDVEGQRNWIKAYQQREAQQKEFYFVILDKEGNKQGLNRIYNIHEDQFEIGSWLYKAQDAISLPIMGDIAVRDFAFETLGLKKCTFEVRKDNKQVLKYHYLFKPTLVKEDADNFYFELFYKDYIKARAFLLKTLKK